MNLLQDIITYVRRIVKTPSNASLSDNLIIDYINRFWMIDMSAEMQLFDLKTTYQFQTQPGVDKYNMPLYSSYTEAGQTVGMYPVYQGFLAPAYINGVQVPIQTNRNTFFNIFPNIIQNLGVVATGNGGTNYNLQLPVVGNPSPPNPPLTGILRGHVDIAGIIATGSNQDPPFGTTINTNILTTSIEAAVWITSLDQYGNNVIVTDSGQFLEFSGNNYANYGLLMQPGNAPTGNTALLGGYSPTLNTINYLTGAINVTFPVGIPAGNDISVQCLYFQTGLPRSILYYNNTIQLRSPPDQQYLVEMDAYLSPAAFLNTSSAIPYGYMAEYIARGAARKILSDTGDKEQFKDYEPLFVEQRNLVWKRSQRQWTNNRTETIYSQGFSQGVGNTQLGGGVL